MEWGNNRNPVQHYLLWFTNILFVEFQDNNIIQYSFVRLLSCFTGYFIIFGDVVHSIYGW
ncbi:UvrD-helicase domain-containing protein, partial [Salmonella enterica subsp. enterica serovar Infantis]